MALAFLALALLSPFAVGGSAWADPAGAWLSPPAGSRISARRPAISVQLPSDPPGEVSRGSAPPLELKLWVNGQEVTRGALRTPSSISYAPQEDLPPGPVEVFFRASRGEGQALERGWRFWVEPKALIHEVRITAPEALGEYDELQVEVSGAPGARAWFDLQDLRPDLPLREVSPGLYQGTYLVQPGDHKAVTSVLVYMERDGARDVRAGPRNIHVFGDLFHVHIVSPKEGERVPSQFQIRGRTRPFASISVIPRLGLQEGLAAPTRGDSDSQAGAIPATADAQGFFTVDYGLPLTLPNMHLVMTITASDAQGNRAVPVTLRVSF